MLILNNVKKIDDQVTADYSFLGNDTVGKVIYDVKERRVLFAEYGNRDPKSVYGFRHLEHVLEMMAEQDRYPEHYEYYWY